MHLQEVPLNHSTIIRFSSPYSSHINLKVYNALGQYVTTLTDNIYDKGEYEVAWDGRSRYGEVVSNGVYLYQLISEDGIYTRKMVMAK